MKPTIYTVDLYAVAKSNLILILTVRFFKSDTKAESCPVSKQSWKA